MRIGELADLAGVTVRTIRYYHQRGILAEPARRSNGYREYTVDHLVTLVRIRQLTQSGLPLAQAGAVMANAAEGSTEATLDEVDEALRQQIALLKDQRRRLAEARAGRHLGLSKLASALVRRPEDVPVSTLFAHLYSRQEHADRLIEALRQPEIQAALDTAQDRFDAIDESTAAEELDQLTDAMRRLVAELTPLMPTAQEEHSDLLLELTERNLNDQQREFLRGLA
ncbi:MerR family transcriptional regulator [Cellulosimicrobium funkei]|nr:MerR family transcriptional regulator [Cellulosimicrobium funkei]